MRQNKTNILKQVPKLIFLIALFSIASIVLGSGKAHAASINVVAGTDGIDGLIGNGQCQLSEAIQNINDQDITNVDCAAGDGNNDTINLPSGTITLSSDLPQSLNSMRVLGTGVGNTIIQGNDGNSTFKGFQIDNTSATFILKDVTITAYKKLAVLSHAGNIDIENVDLDGQGFVEDGDCGGVILGNETNSTNTITIKNVNIHDFNTSTDYIHMLNIWSTDGSTTNANVDNVSVTNIINPSGGINVMGIGVGVMSFGSSGIFNANINNVTVDNIHAGTTATAIGVISSAILGDAISNVNVSNVTVRNLRSMPGYFGPIGLPAIGVETLENDGFSAETNMFVKNTLLTDSVFNGSDPLNCGMYDFSPTFMLTGSGVNTLTSLGGNISDDDTCSSYFTQPTDQNNVNPTDLHLGTLGDHGGSVPTIPLLEGSIAIDSGVTVNGLTTDARGISRPQCAAYDSGAYEYNGTCPATNNTPTPLTYPDPITGSTVTLELPEGVTNGTVSPISPNAIPKDSVFTYPLGLTTFTFNTTIGATKTITLYYDLPGDPSTYTARKYNTTTKTFSTIPNATITRTTYNNKSMIKLTYDITDGGTLDQDGTANGTIIDPVGLAQATVGVPNTGL